MTIGPRRIIQLIALGIIVVIIAASGWLFYTYPLLQMRTDLTNLYVSLPSSTIRLRLRLAIIRNDYAEAINLLKKQKHIAEKIGFTNYMKHDLVENTWMAVEGARSTGDQELFLDWLNELEETAPNEYKVLIMQANSQNGDIAKVKAASAIKLLPIDEAPYRALIRNSLNNGESKQIKPYCNNLQSAQLGAIDAWADSDLTFPAQGLRTLGLTAINNSHKTYSTTQGLKVGSWSEALFDFPTPQTAKKLALLLPMAAGVKFSISTITLTTEKGLVQYSTDQVAILATYGYALSENQFVIASKQGDTLVIFPPKELPEFSQISINYKLERLPPVNLKACQEQ